MTEQITPSYYKLENGEDLLTKFEKHMTQEELAGFAGGNIIKYVTRYANKDGIKDLKEAFTYSQRVAAIAEHGSTVTLPSDSVKDTLSESGYRDLLKGLTISQVYTYLNNPGDVTPIVNAGLYLGELIKLETGSLAVSESTTATTQPDSIDDTQVVTVIDKESQSEATDEPAA